MLNAECTIRWSGGWLSAGLPNQSGALSVSMAFIDLDNGDGSVFEQVLNAANPMSSTGGIRYALFPFNNSAGRVQIRNRERQNRD